MCSCCVCSTCRHSSSESSSGGFDFVCNKFPLRGSTFGPGRPLGLHRITQNLTNECRGPTKKKGFVGNILTSLHQSFRSRMGEFLPEPCFEISSKPVRNNAFYDWAKISMFLCDESYPPVNSEPGPCQPSPNLSKGPVQTLGPSYEQTVWTCTHMKENQKLNKNVFGRPNNVSQRLSELVHFCFKHIDLELCCVVGSSMWLWIVCFFFNWNRIELNQKLFPWSV